MDYKAKQQLSNILFELRSISNELNSIANELDKVKGLGAENCKLKLYKISNKYKNARIKLSKLD